MRNLYRRSTIELAMVTSGDFPKKTFRFVVIKMYPSKYAVQIANQQPPLPDQILANQVKL